MKFGLDIDQSRMPSVISHLVRETQVACLCLATHILAESRPLLMVERSSMSVQAGGIQRRNAPKLQSIREEVSFLRSRSHVGLQLIPDPSVIQMLCPEVDVQVD